MDRKILLVDDSQDLLDAYVAVVQSSTPHQVRGAASGRAALEIVREWHPDVVVTDIMMPDMNGLELITQMLSELPPPLPIIVACSGFPGFEEEARRRGARIFQPKPLDPDELILLIESLLAERQPPAHLRAGAEARRRAASELAQAKVSATLARHPYFREVAELYCRLISRYFDGADVGLLTMDDGKMRVFAASASRGGGGTRFESVVLDYALDVVASGSTLIVPDIATMSARVSRAPARDSGLLAAVPLRTEGVTIGALALADRRSVPFDAHDLAILENIGANYADVLAGTEASPLPREPGVLLGESWRHRLRSEIEHLHPGRALVVALASQPVKSRPMFPISSPEDLEIVTLAVAHALDQLLPRTAVGRIAPALLAAYSLATDAAEGEHALHALVASLADEPDRACVGVLTVTGLHPTDGGAAFLELAHWLLASAMAQGPGTTLRARLSPEVVAARRAAA